MIAWSAILALALFASAAHADCLPAAAGGTGGPLHSRVRIDATLFAWRCPDNSVVAFAAPSDWGPTLPHGRTALNAELRRLLVMHGYSREPGWLRSEALALIGGSWT